MPVRHVLLAATAAAIVALVTPASSQTLRYANQGELKSLEECLREAAEYDRLARLKSSRKVLTLSASYWHKRAQDAAKRAGDSRARHLEPAPHIGFNVFSAHPVAALTLGSNQP